MRPFNADLELTKPYENVDKKYNHLFHIGVITTAGRLLTTCDRLIKQLNQIVDVPVSMIINTKHDWEQIPEDWPMDIELTDELVSLNWMRNQLTLKYRDTPYIIILDDDAVILRDDFVEQIAYAHKNTGFDFIRGWSNQCCNSYHKSVISNIGWWDEKYYGYGGEDVEWHLRLEKWRHSQGLDHNKARFTNGVLVNHPRSRIHNWKGSNAAEIHLQKWGFSSVQPENDEEAQKLYRHMPEIDYYPRYQERFKSLEKII